MTGGVGAGMDACDDEAGFTLADALVALAMVGLAMGGLAEAARLTGRLQGVSAAALQMNQTNLGAGRMLSGLVADLRPSALDSVRGDDGALGFDCGSARCTAELRRDGLVSVLTTKDASGQGRTQRLPQRTARFVYEGEDGLIDAWPPRQEGAHALRSVSLLGGTPEGPIAMARIWREQDAACVFDPISGGCRPANP